MFIIQACYRQLSFYICNMSEEVVKEKVKRQRKVAVEQPVQEEAPVPLITADSLKTAAGLFLLFLSIFLFVAFVSYLFTWKADQDKVLSFSWKIIFSKDALVENTMGRMGAFLAHTFFYVLFGVASFFIPYILFCWGVNVTFKEKVFRINKIVLTSCIWIVFIATTAAFLFPNFAFPFGGGMGTLLYDWLSTFIGRVGLGILLAILGFTFLGFNIKDTFMMLKKWKQQWELKRAALKGEKEKKKKEKQQLIAQDEFYADEEEELNKEAGYEMESILPETKEDVTPHFEDKTFEILNENTHQINPDLLEMELIEKEDSVDISETEKGIELLSENDAIVELPSVPVEEKKSSRKKVKEEIDFEIEELQAFGSIDTQSLLETDTKEQVLEAENDSSKNEMQHFGLDVEYDPKLELSGYTLPPINLMEEHGSGQIEINKEELEQHKNQIVQTLSHYNIGIEKIKATVGPTVTLYEIVPEKGIRISKIKNLEDDIALSLAALGIRIIAPIPGRGTIGIEVPNVKKSIVSMRSLISGEKFQRSDFDLPVALGKTISNEDFVVDLAKMPHLLMAGATGQGKSVGLNAILVSLLYKKHPAELKFVLVDPKKVELTLYKLIENHYLAQLPDEEEAIITDTKKVIYTLNALCIEMDKRYDLLKSAHVRHIKEYNQKFLNRQLNPHNGHRFLPYIVLVVDEFADLMMTAGKEIEGPIARLAQLARAVGIHLVIATQRPSVNIITGTIKANFPGRIAFKVTAKVDSRTILDAGGADQLIGRGDMLLSQSGEITRLQCPFVDTPEVEKIAKFIGDQRGFPTPYELPEYVDPKEASSEKQFDFGDKDDLFEEAARLIVRNQIGSTSLIQRKLALGYARSGRLMDQLEAVGIVGPNLGSKAREVYVKTDEELERILQEYA